MRVIVGSENPVKLAAVRDGFRAVFPDEAISVHGVNVPSGVPSQPMSDRESIRGARNRAKNAFHLDPKADYGVGVEGGLQKIGRRWFDCGWIVVRNRSGQEGIGSTIRVETPARLMQLIGEGKELGEANDLVFGRTNSKQAEGHFGLMTRGVITRATGYRDGVVAALAYFLHPELFPG